jgi:hypothetical protein
MSSLSLTGSIEMMLDSFVSLALLKLIESEMLLLRTSVEFEKSKNFVFNGCRAIFEKRKKREKNNFF